MTSPTDGLALQIEGWLAEQVAALDLDHRSGPGKPRVLPALLLWTGLVVCLLRGMQSQAALWRLLSQRGLWSFPRIPISDDAVRARLARDGTAPLERLFTQVTTLLVQRIAPFVETKLATFATDILVIDAITLDKVARLLPTLRELPPGDPGLLAGTLAALFDVRRQQWRRILYRADTLQNEKVAARSLVAGLAAGTLLLCDLGYFGFKWFDDLTDGGVFWLSRLRHRTSYDPITILYEQGDTLDAIVWLGKHRADRAKHAVRLIQFPAKGRVYRYITNVLDPAQLSMREAAQLYARRWDIEMAISILKTELRLHLIWAANPVVIQQQIWAILIIHQIFAAFRLEIAGRAEVDLFDVSLPLLIEYFPHYAHAGTDPIDLFVECGRELGFIRPSSRHETQAPVIPLDDYHTLPPDLVLERKPRYAERRCERKAS
jgi:hypothetical protein